MLLLEQQGGSEGESMVGMAVVVDDVTGDDDGHDEKADAA